ncbi:MAG: hypothetical protein LIP01_07190 [Tannerellaceae bacterium]|nr:hypothetical protein [Tannerellaceae bacterium]
MYEFIEPYIDVLSVNQLNIENASFAFQVENPFNPMLYQIRDIDLYTYNFRLDSNSFANGNLLYSEHFEFISDRHQTLLVNNDFLLEADTILINTKDSLVLLKDIQLIQKDSMDNHGYIEGEIPVAKLQGAAFRREKAFNSLYADSFTIDVSDLRIFSPGKSGKTLSHPADSLSPDSLPPSFLYSFSLYDFISPVLQRVNIEQIHIGETRLDYSYLKENERETIRIERLTFSADNFVIDSVFEQKYGIRYVQHCTLEAENGFIDMPSINQQMIFDSLLLNTKEGYFHLSTVDIQPVTMKCSKSFIAGKLAGLTMDSIQYKNGLSIGKIEINQPLFHVYQGRKKKRNKHKPDSTPFSPLFQFLTVQEASLNKGTIILYDTRHKPTWKFKNLNTRLTGVIFTPETWNSTPGFICNELGIRIADFDNYIQQDNYQLKLKKGYYSSRSGKLDIQDIHLIPQTETWKQTPTSYVDIQIDGIQTSGLKNIWKNTDYLQADSLSIRQPFIQIAKTDNSLSATVQEKAEEVTPPSNLSGN